MNEEGSGAPRGAALVGSILDKFDRIDSAGYVGISEIASLPDGRRVEHESRYWTSRILLTEADPFAAHPPAEHSVHWALADTFDVLRHEYVFQDYRMVILESVNRMLIRVRASRIDQEADHLQAVPSAGGDLLRVHGQYIGDDFREHDYNWVFRPVSSSGGDTRFSTAPDVDITEMWSWANRIDACVRGGALSFLIFKVREPTDGKLIYLDGRHWFDGRCWQPYE